MVVLWQKERKKGKMFPPLSLVPLTVYVDGVELCYHILLILLGTSYSSFIITALLPVI